MDDALLELSRTPCRIYLSVDDEHEHVFRAALPSLDAALDVFRVIARMVPSSAVVTLCGTGPDGTAYMAKYRESQFDPDSVTFRGPSLSCHDDPSTAQVLCEYLADWAMDSANVSYAAPVVIGRHAFSLGVNGMLYAARTDPDLCPIEESWRVVDDDEPDTSEMIYSSEEIATICSLVACSQYHQISKQEPTWDKERWIAWVGDEIEGRMRMLGRRDVVLESMLEQIHGMSGIKDHAGVPMR